MFKFCWKKSFVSPMNGAWDSTTVKETRFKKIKIKKTDVDANN